MRTKEQIIQLIKDGKLVVDCKGYAVDTYNILYKAVTGKEVVSEWNYIGKYNVFYYWDPFLSEWEGLEVIPLSEYLNEPNEVFRGNREYDEALLKEFTMFCMKDELEDFDKLTDKFLDHKYGNDEAIQRQIAENEAAIEELKKKLK